MIFVIGKTLLPAVPPLINDCVDGHRGSNLDRFTTTNSSLDHSSPCGTFLDSSNNRYAWEHVLKIISPTLHPILRAIMEHFVWSRKNIFSLSSLRDS